VTTICLEDPMYWDS